MPENVSVRFRDCACPGTPHPDEGDIAELLPYLGFEAGAEARASVTIISEDENGETIGLLAPPVEWAARMGPVFLRNGVAAWNLLDEDGEPVPVTREALEGLRYEDAYELADRADDLYGPQVLAPLLKRMPKPSKTGRTGGSTRHPRSSSPSHPELSEPSS